MSENKTKKPVFKTLNSISVQEHTKKKQNLDYLEWSTAITLADDAFPDEFSYKVKEFPTKIFRQILVEKTKEIKNTKEEKESGSERVIETEKYAIVEDVQPLQYCSDGRTAWVEVEVTVADRSISETLAIMDNRNKSIPVNDITSTDVNKAIKRCLVKGLANLGLGLSCWQKDLDESENATTEKVKNLEKANTAIETFKQKIAAGFDRDKLISFLKENYGTGNPQTIKDAVTLNKLKADLDALNPDDFKTEKKSK